MGRNNAAFLQRTNSKAKIKAKWVWVVLSSFLHARTLLVASQSSGMLGIPRQAAYRAA
jgi:hypothetical protein